MSERKILERRKAILVLNEPTYHLTDLDGDPLEIPAKIGERTINFLISTDLTMDAVCNVEKQYGVEIININDFK